MHAFRSLIMATLAAALVACTSDSAEEREVNQVLLQSNEVIPDTVETHLRTLQRDLARALGSTDTSALGQLLSPHVIAHDTDEPESVPGKASRPWQAGYLQIVSGALARRVDTDYHTFHISYEGELATTYAIAQQSAIRTTWRQLASGWEATQLILLGAEGARAMIDSQK